MILRKLLAGALVGVAVWIVASLLGLGAQAEGTEQVLVATSDLPAGHRLAESDTRQVAVASEAIPESARSVTVAELEEGRVLTAALGTGEMVTSTRLRSPDTFDNLSSDQRAIRVALDDGAPAALLRPGSRVDVHAATDGHMLVQNVAVLQVDDADGTDSPGVVLSVPTSTTAAVMAAMGSSAEAGGGVTLAIRGE